MSVLTPEVLARSPEDMRLIADIVADKAQDRRLSRKRAYAVARRLNAKDLLECYRADDFLAVFRPYYDGRGGD